MKILCNINCCDQETYLITENLSRSTLKPPLAGDCLVWHDIYCEGRKWEVVKARDLNQDRQRDRGKIKLLLRQKAGTGIKCSENNWRRAASSRLQTQEAKNGREGEIAALIEIKFCTLRYGCSLPCAIHTVTHGIKAAVGRIEKRVDFGFEWVQLPGPSPLTPVRSSLSPKPLPTASVDRILRFELAFLHWPSSVYLYLRGGGELPAAWAGDAVRFFSCSDWLFDPVGVDSSKWP